MLAICVKDTLGPDVNVEMPDTCEAFCTRSWMGEQVFSSFNSCSFRWRSIKLLMLQVEPLVSSGGAKNYNNHVTYMIPKDAILFAFISFALIIRTRKLP